MGFAKPGDIIAPRMTYAGSWMHGYVYLDFQNSGQFASSLNNDGTPAEGSSVVAYSYYDGKNSTGSAMTNQNPGVNPPEFTLPADMEKGNYRMRFKVDWDNIDPKGNISTDNHIVNNGGAFVDVLLNVHSDVSNVTVQAENGKILNADKTNLSGTEIAFGEAIEIEIEADSAYELESLTIKHGHLSNPEFIHSNRQWRIETVDLAQVVGGKYTIPAQFVDGGLEITAVFNASTGVDITEINKYISISTAHGNMTVNTSKLVSVSLYDLAGKTLFTGELNGTKHFTLPAGVYFVNQQKVVIK